MENVLIKVYNIFIVRKNRANAKHDSNYFQFSNLGDAFK